MLLQLQLARHVTFELHVVGDDAALIAHRRNGGLVGVQAAIFPLVDNASVPHLPGANGRPQLLEEAVVVFPASEDVQGLPNHFATPIAGDTLEGRIDIKNDPVGIKYDHALGGLLYGSAQALLRLGQMRPGQRPRHLIGHAPGQADFSG